MVKDKSVTGKSLYTLQIYPLTSVLSCKFKGSETMNISYTFVSGPSSARRKEGLTVRPFEGASDQAAAIWSNICFRAFIALTSPTTSDDNEATA